MERNIQGKVLTYSEILRVMGRYMDRHDLGEARLIETGDGFILQGIVLYGERAGMRETYQLTVDDILDLKRNATNQRGKLI